MQADTSIVDYGDLEARAQAAAGLHTSAGDLGRFLAAHLPGRAGEPVGHSR